MKWISIKDEKPNDKQCVIGAAPYETAEIGMWSDEKGFGMSDGNWEWTWKITHWMPVPEPPPEET